MIYEILSSCSSSSPHQPLPQPPTAKVEQPANLILNPRSDHFNLTRTSGSLQQWTFNSTGTCAPSMVKEGQGCFRSSHRLTKRLPLPTGLHGIHHRALSFLVGHARGLFLLAIAQSREGGVATVRHIILMPQLAIRDRFLLLLVNALTFSWLLSPPLTVGVSARPWSPSKKPAQACNETPCDSLSEQSRAFQSFAALLLLGVGYRRQIWRRVALGRGGFFLSLDPGACAI